MAEYIVTDTDMISVADTIRAKGGTSADLAFPLGFNSAINAIPTGGAQPTLYAPVVTGGVNEISWANNPYNGAFTVTLTADVDGTPVTSPLTITQAMNGSTLTITASATNFESATTSILLYYLGETTSLTSIGAANATGSAYESIQFTVSATWADWYLNGSLVTNNNRSFYAGVAGDKSNITVTDEVYMLATETKVNPTDYLGVSTLWRNSKYIGFKTGYIPSQSGTYENNIYISIVCHDIDANEDVFSWSRTFTANNSGGMFEPSATFTQGHRYRFITNVTLTPKT